MPGRRFKRRYGGRKRRFSRRPRARRLSRFIKRVIKRSTEVKYSTATATDQVITAGTWSLTNVSPTIVQGVARAQRIGNHVQFKRVCVSIRFDAVALAAIGGLEQIASYRISLVQPRIEALAIADITTASITNSNIYTPYNTTAVRTIRDWKGIISIKPISGSALADTYVPSSIFRRVVIRLPYNVNFKSDVISTLNDPKDQTWIMVGLSGGGNTQGYINASFRYSYIDV